MSSSRKRPRNSDDHVAAAGKGELDVDDDRRRRPPIRDVNNLYASHITLHCAFEHGCVPCAYKICCFDVAMDKEFCRAVPNQRPEMCLRSKLQTGQVGTLGYAPGMKILTVGDGDFTYSLAIARMVSGKGLVATSYESRGTLNAVYPGVEETLSELETLGATIHFKIDATRIRDTLPMNKEKLFDRIVWNFPCEAVSKGQDGQNEEMERNKDLVRKFVANARHLLEQGGEIHMNHKTKPPFNQWKIENVALEESIQDKPRIQYFGRIVFDRYMFPPYVPRKALDRKSFPSHDACTFVFGRELDGVEDVNPLRAAVKEYKGKGENSPVFSLAVVDDELILRIRADMLHNKNCKRIRQKR